MTRVHGLCLLALLELEQLSSAEVEWLSSEIREVEWLSSGEVEWLCRAEVVSHVRAELTHRSARRARGMDFQSVPFVGLPRPTFPR